MKDKMRKEGFISLTNCGKGKRSTRRKKRRLRQIIKLFFKFLAML